MASIASGLRICSAGAAFAGTRVAAGARTETAESVPLHPASTSTTVPAAARLAHRGFTRITVRGYRYGPLRDADDRSSAVGIVVHGLDVDHGVGHEGKLAPDPCRHRVTDLVRLGQGQ